MAAGNLAPPTFNRRSLVCNDDHSQHTVMEKVLGIPWHNSFFKAGAKSMSCGDVFPIYVVSRYNVPSYYSNHERVKIGQRS
jgi:hypothetical protein